MMHTPATHVLSGAQVSTAHLEALAGGYTAVSLRTERPNRAAEMKGWYASFDATRKVGPRAAHALVGGRHHDAHHGAQVAQAMMLKH